MAARDMAGGSGAAVDSEVVDSELEGWAAGLEVAVREAAGLEAAVRGAAVRGAAGSEAAAANESDRGRQGKDTFLLVCRNQKR